MSAPASPPPEGGSLVRVETAEQDGHPVTVVRDAAGNIIYPSYIPAVTQPPPASGAPWQPRDPSTSTGPGRQEQELTPEEAPEEISLDVHGPSRRPPPPAAKRWTTELSRSPDTNTAGVVRWASADILKMGQAAHETSGSDSSSSSEDSEEDDDDQAPGRTEKKKQAKRPPRAGDETDRYRRFHVGNEHYRTKGKVSKRDGRLKISLKDTSNTGYLAKALGTAARKMAPLTKPTTPTEPQSLQPSSLKKRPSTTPIGPSRPPPRLNIVIMVIGSRGDAQPFLKIARLLHTQYHHRVRIATHPAFRDFIASDCPGVEFFSVGGDPAELMSFMVKNPGMIPTLESVKRGDISRRRQAMRDMFEGFWRGCVNSTDRERDPGNLRVLGEGDPFVADAIIANPPCFAHVHCAEALGIPVHLVFTFPYTPTQAFPHPLASVRKSNVDPGYTNWISYPLVEMMVWQGLGDLVNEFRVRTLGLDPVSTLWAPGATYRLHVPFTYLWSPGLVPKPPDWGEEIDVAGFVFLDLASSFEPPGELVRFLEEGEGEGEKPLVYIGFGSIVVDDADRFTDMIFEAVKMAGVRALVSKGWGGLGGDSLEVPDGVFMLDNTPHDWLFPRVRACVIHGGAGTTAIALKCGKPTMIVPFFGDQHFWGTMVGNAGAGPPAVEYKNLTAEKLADGIKYCMTDDARKEAEKIARDIEREGDGAENACRSFHRGLVLQGKDSMRCSILPDRTAVWQMKKTGLRLSAVAAEMLVERGSVSWKKLRLLRHNEWNDFEGPGEPLTGAAGSLMTSVGNIFGGVGGVPYRIGKSAKRRREKQKKKKEKNKGREGADSGASKQKPENSQPNGPAEPDDSDEDIPHVETTTTHAITRQGTASTTASNPAKDVVRQVGRGTVKTASAVVNTPVDLTVALAQGFHNAPRLYGDDTVRRPTRVTGIRSGLRAARHEFVYGIYDGWTGVVRLPYRGARDDGVRGFVSGVGMGLTGFVLKDIAAIIGPVGYTLKGVVKQAGRRRRPVRYIRRARVVQGQRESSAMPEEERRERQNEVADGWRLMRQLWEEMKRVERRKEGSWRGRFSGSARRLRRSREWDVVFENVDVAQRAMDALKEGNGLDSVLEERRGSVGKSDIVPPVDVSSKASSGLADETPSPGSVHGSVHDTPADGSISEKPAPGGDVTEDENPFSTDNTAIAENKAENRQTLAALDIQP